MMIDVSTIGALAIMNRINNIDNGTVNDWKWYIRMVKFVIHLQE